MKFNFNKIKNSKILKTIRQFLTRRSAKRKAEEAKQALEDTKIVMQYLISYKGGKNATKAPEHVQAAYERYLKRRTKGKLTPLTEQQEEVVRAYHKSGGRAFYAYLEGKTFGSNLDDVKSDINAAKERPEFMSKIITELNNKTTKVFGDDKITNRARGNELIKVWSFYTDLMKDYLEKVSHEELEDGINTGITKYNPHDKLKVDKEKAQNPGASL